jgi:hypothetical protein
MADVKHNARALARKIRHKELLLKVIFESGENERLGAYLRKYHQS